VILDELNMALRWYLDLHAVVAVGRAPPGLHVVVTGRNAKPN
jgi:cob(I)alamin adenosyltransferase